jgi:hypothetical protein
VIIFPGRKLEYETDCCEKPKNEQNFMTAVEFSTENPYGKAVALLNLKSGFLKVFSFVLLDIKLSRIITMTIMLRF